MSKGKKGLVLDMGLLSHSGPAQVSDLEAAPALCGGHGTRPRTLVRLAGFACSHPGEGCTPMPLVFTGREQDDHDYPNVR